MKSVSAVLTIDTREQLAYSFSGCESKYVAFELRREGLKAGDYAAHLIGEDSLELTCVIERKSHSDLVGTLTSGRQRFERELQRLEAYGYAAIVVEASLAKVARGLPGNRTNPRAVIGSLLAFDQRHGVRIFFGDDRQHSEALTFRILERWVRDRAELAAEARQMHAEVTV